MPLYRVIEWVKNFSHPERRAFWADDSMCRNAADFKWFLGVALDIRRKAPEA